MKNRSKRMIRRARRIYRFLQYILGRQPGKEQIILQSYRGFTNGRRVFVKGRVLQDKNIRVGPRDSRLRNLINSFKRFESDELPGARLTLHINGQAFDLVSDEEGYFSLFTELDAPLPRTGTHWQEAKVELFDLPGRKVEEISTTVPLHFPPTDAAFGVISDIDDTVLLTHVTSTLGLRMLYTTLMGNAHQRMPMEGVVELFQALTRGLADRPVNPVFYVSNSPWNIYDLLVRFMELQQLPRGPILLRDYGLSPANFSSAFREHKQESITAILEIYPYLPFILLGDTGSQDADHYLEIARRHPGQVKTIYIRNLGDTPNARRVAQIIETTQDVDILLVEKTEEIWRDARRKGYVL